MDNTEQKPQEDLDLEYARHIRMLIADDLTANGTVVPEHKYKRLLLETLDGLDNSALNRKKLKNEEETNNNNKAVATMIAEIFNTVDIKRQSIDTSNSGTIKELDTSVIDINNINIVPGELDNGSFDKKSEFTEMINRIES